MKDNRQEDVLRRLLSIEGHVRGVARMVEEGEDCPAVLRQIVALHGSLDKLSQIFMGEHLTACIPEGLEGEARDDLERALADVSNLLLVSRHG